MTTTGLRTIDHSLNTTQEWLRDLVSELGVGDQEEAFVILRAVLHTLRDRLTIEEAAQFSAQLPMLLQGLYYHEWTPKGKPVKMRHLQEFLDAVAEKMMRDYDPEAACRAVFRVLTRHMPGGGIEDVKRILPESIRALWSE